MIPSTMRSILFAMFLLGPISVFAPTFSSPVAATNAQLLKPAVARGTDGYLRVFCEKLGLKFETYDHWIKSGALPVSAPPRAFACRFCAATASK